MARNGGRKETEKADNNMNSVHGENRYKNPWKLYQSFSYLFPQPALGTLAVTHPIVKRSDLTVGGMTCRDHSAQLLPP